MTTSYPFQPSEDPVDNLAEINRRIAQTAKKAGRLPSAITLVAVSKRQNAQKILRLLGAGHRVFGENRLQEAQEKWPDLKSRAWQVELHMLGTLQTNKVKEAVALFDAVHTLDRPKLARVLADEMARQGRRLKLFVQVNTGEEPQKSGVFPGHVDGFLRQCREEFQLEIVGLMCLPPINEEAALHFALLAKLAARNGLSQLSMGMSHDFEKAIQFGATHVRIGSLLMGPRNPSKAV